MNQESKWKRLSIGWRILYNKTIKTEVEGEGIMQAKENKLTPLLKYPGGKDKELKYILPNIPKDALNYYEPFVGGGAVYFSLDSAQYYINDKSTELIWLYRMVKEQNREFLEKLNEMEENWSAMGRLMSAHTQELVRIYKAYQQDRFNMQQLGDAVSEFVFANAEAFNGLLRTSFNVEIDNFVAELHKSFKNKIVRMKKLEQEKGVLPEADVILNLEGAFKNAFYMHFRYLYNHIEELGISVPFATAIYFFIREYCYASMFRYNRQGKFNVPYGGISYNDKSMAKKAAYFQDQDLLSQLNKTTIVNLDFEEFVQAYEPGVNDFMFLDPPYDTQFSTYAQNEFGQNDQARLAAYLTRRCRARFMLVIKNTDYIRSLYPAGQMAANGGQIEVHQFDKKYLVNFRERNDKNAQHLIITNYRLTQ